MSQDKKNVHFRCMVSGDEGVGKKSFLFTYRDGKCPTEYVPTIFDDYSAQFLVNDTTVYLQMAPALDKKSFESLLPGSYAPADIVIFCFSLVDLTTFDNVENFWVPMADNHAPQGYKKFLVGTKLDLRDEFISQKKETISTEKGEDLRKKIGAIKYFEISSFNNFNIKEVFDEVAKASITQTSKPAKSKEEKKSHKFSFFSKSKKSKDDDKKQKSSDSKSKKKTKK